MTYQLTQARTLCTKAELALFEASRGEQLKAITPVRLQGKVKRARDLRNKYRDLYKRQRLAARTRTGSKKGERPDSNARTGQKAELFAEVLERFEQRAAQQKTAQKKVAASKSAKTTLARVKAKKRATPATTAKAKKKAKAPRGSSFVSDAAHSADRRKFGRDTRSKTRVAHSRAAASRVQARRDSRR